MVTKHLHAEAYTAAELKEILGQSLETLFAGSEASLLVLKHNTTGSSCTIGLFMSTQKRRAYISSWTSARICLPSTGSVS